MNFLDHYQGLVELPPVEWAFETCLLDLRVVVFAMQRRRDFTDGCLAHAACARPNDDGMIDSLTAMLERVGKPLPKMAALVGVGNDVLHEPVEKARIAGSRFYAGIGPDVIAVGLGYSVPARRKLDVIVARRSGPLKEFLRHRDGLRIVV